VALAYVGPSRWYFHAAIIYVGTSSSYYNAALRLSYSLECLILSVLLNAAIILLAHNILSIFAPAWSLIDSPLWLRIAHNLQAAVFCKVDDVLAIHDVTIV
jgi:hypothetical protein